MIDRPSGRAPLSVKRSSDDELEDIEHGSVAPEAPVGMFVEYVQKRELVRVDQGILLEAGSGARAGLKSSCS